MITALLVSVVVLGAIGMPLAFAMGIGASLAVAVHGSLPYELIAQRTMNALDKFPFLAVPMFILAGELMNTSGITDRIIRFCMALVGHMRGGLGLVTVLASMFFSGISGSATADAAGIGKVLVPAMIREGFDEDYAVSLMASAATMGPIIPPSVLMIVYASMTNLSIGKLFMAGLIPGVLIGVSLMILAYVYARIRNYPSQPRQALAEVGRSFIRSFFPLVAPFIIVFGIVGGVFTATEAGTVVVFYAMLLGVCYGELDRRTLYQALVRSVESTVIILFIIASASILGWLLAMGRFPAMLVQFLTGLTSNVHLILLLVIAALILLGLFVDGMAILVILVPVMAPVAQSLGIDAIHFATLIVVCVMIGGVTPPFGILLYISCQVGNVPLSRVTATVWYFVATMMVVVFMVAYIPQLTTWLPDVLFR